MKKFLGEGGRKKVYLANDTVLDRDVAFALIKTEGLDDSAKMRIVREAQAMGRLGSHPHIVTVFDMGEYEKQPYMVTEFMAGGDVESLIERAPDHRASLDRAVEIAKQVCRGLEFAHSRGIVHRDLKPGNVWLAEDGTAKIGDFGLALPMGRPRITQEGTIVGTVSYMSPEQAMGEKVTPRTDLYSLGCMLYEMVTGRPPFLGDDPVAIISQHVNTPPVAPTWHNSRCPRPLEALIMRLLAKDPTQRTDSAADVLSALEAIDVTAAEAQLPEEKAPILDSLAGGVFVGRQREMGELKAALEEALSGRGRLVMLVGEPGIGKTRTALELATYAGLRHAQVLWGRCYESEGAPSFWPWVQAIRSYVRERTPQQLRSEMGAGAADIAQIVSEVRRRLPGLETPPELESPEAARFRLFDSIAAFLKNASERQPLALILDDLHSADKPSLLLLRFVARELATARLLVIGAYRDVELSRKHPLSQTLGELTRERLFQRVLLRGLSQDDVARFIELTTGFTPPEGLVKAVYAQTEGNPLFVSEVVRLLVQEEELTPERVSKRESWTVRIPEGVREVIGRRLDRLSERCNQTLTTASVIGREFTFQQLHRLIDDLSEERLLEVLEEALGARVIEEMPRTVGRYQFSHGLIQETLMGELSTTRRARLHARVAQALEGLYGPEAEAHAAELAHHFAEAETLLGSGKLVRYSLLAGERSLGAYAYEEAASHFGRALAAKEGQPMDGETAAALSGLGRSETAVVQGEEAVGHLRRAFDFYVQARDIAHAVAVAGATFPGMPGREGMAPIMERALALVSPGSIEAGRLLSTLGRYFGLKGDYEGAERAFERALTIADRENDVALKLNALTNSGNVDACHLHVEEATEKSLRAIELARSFDSPSDESLAHIDLAAILLAKGDLKQAKIHAAAGLAAAERLRDRERLATACAYQASTTLAEGDWRAARSLSDRALGLWGWTGSDRVLLECEVGDFERSETFLKQLLDGTYAAGFDYTADLALVIPMVGRITGAGDRLDIAEMAAGRVLSSSHSTPVEILWAKVGMALIAIQRGDADAAAEHYATLKFPSGVIKTLSVSSARLLGLLAQTAGKLDEAMAHFDEALAFCRKAGYRPELAWTCCDYADALLQRNSPGDQHKATKLLDEALAISRELGMRPLMERVLARRAILKA